MLDVSVVLPLNKVDGFLDLAVNSTLSSLRYAKKKWELILVVNGPSSEKVREYCQSKWGAIHEVVILTFSAMGLAGSLNEGIRFSSGKYVARMDSDDICKIGRFSRFFEIASKENVQFYFCNAELIDHKGNIIKGVLRNYESYNIESELWKSCDLIHPTLIARRDLFFDIGGYNILTRSEDYELWMRALVSGVSFFIDDYVGLGYRAHPEQNTNLPGLKKTFFINFTTKLKYSYRLRSIYILYCAFGDFFRYIYLSVRSFG